MPEIFSHTGLRGLAALLVFVVHLNYDTIMGRFWFLSPYPVDLFFVLSGFILNWVYLGPERPLRWRSYFRARAARILPLYYLTTLFCLPLVAYTWSNQTSATSAKDVLLNLSLLSGVFDTVTFNGPAWSIGVEYFCYVLVFPILVALVRLCGRQWLLLAVSVFVVLAFSRGLVLCYRGEIFGDAAGLFSNRFLQRGIIGFTIGFFLCTVFLKVRYDPWPAWMVNFAAFLFSALLVLALSKVIPPHLALYIMPALVFFTAFDSGLIARGLKWSPLQWLGVRSYSIYLWHQPIINYTEHLRGLISEPVYTVAIFLTVFVVSQLSYRYFEMPARNAIRAWGSGGAATRKE